MQKSAFKYHSGKKPVVNVLEYFLILKEARGKLLEMTNEKTKGRKVSLKNDQTGIYEIFRIRRRKEKPKSKYPFKIIRAYKPKSKKSKFGSKGLKVLTVELIRFFHKNKEKDLSLDYVSQQLYIEKRKIYDLINIFSSFHLIRKVGKGNYVWNGVKSMEMKLKEVLGESLIRIMQKALVGEKITDTFVPYKNKIKGIKEKSLGVLAFNFIRLLKSRKIISIEKAAELLTDSLERNKFKTKIRRLYDVSKILVSIGLIKQVQDNKRSALEWTGIANMKITVEHMLKKSKNKFQVNDCGKKQLNAGNNFLLLMNLMFKKSKENDQNAVNVNSNSASSGERDSRLGMDMEESEMERRVFLGKRAASEIKEEDSDDSIECEGTDHLAFPVASIPSKRKKLKLQVV